GRRLRRGLSATFSTAALPRRWRFVRQLPTGSLGKVSTPDLIALFGSSENELPADRPKIEPDVLACRPTADGVELDLRVNSDLAPLAGHFPNLPIVPGVCIVDWAVRFAVGNIGFVQDGARHIQVKFPHGLQPGCDVKL